VTNGRSPEKCNTEFNTPSLETKTGGFVCFLTRSHFTKVLHGKMHCHEDDVTSTNKYLVSFDEWAPGNVPKFGSRFLG
jgi:hypothetical protein